MKKGRASESYRLHHRFVRMQVVSTALDHPPQILVSGHGDTPGSTFAKVSELNSVPGA
jgi:hypothetical protein